MVTRREDWLGSWGAVVVLVLSVTVARLVYLAWLCPYTLVEDEASYWEWARHLDWSYYTKGPGIAWTIAAAVRVLGDSALAVRAPMVICSAAAALLVAGLARDVSGQRRAGFYAAACFFLVPAFQFCAMLATIDGPYVACWAGAAWAGWRVAGRGSIGAWLSLGAVLGLGALYKYTMLLVLPGLVGFAWLASGEGKPRATSGQSRSSVPGMVLATAAFLAVSSPIVIWNQQHHWPTLGHLLGHLGVAGGDKPVIQGGGGWHYDPRWTLSFLGAQAVAGPVLVLVWLQGRKLHRERRERPDRWRGAAYLVWMAAPLLAFYLVVSFVATTQWNWTIAAYVTLAVLAGWGVAEVGTATYDADRSAAASSRTSLEVRVWWRAAVIVGLVAGFGALRLDLLAAVPRVGKWVPLWRFSGADQMAGHVARLVADVRGRTGREPFIMAQHYGRAAQMAFYLEGHPRVYCSSSLMLDGRLTPYDFWADTSLWRDQGLVGRDAVLIGNSAEDWGPLFDRVEEVGTLEGDGKKNRPAFLAYNFHGFPPGGLRSPGAPVFMSP